MTRLRFLGVAALAACLGVGALASSSAAAPPARKAVKKVLWKNVVEDGWKAELPRDWTRTSRCEYGQRQRFSWLYQSPKRNFSFKVTLLRDRGEPLKKVMDRVWHRTRRGVRQAEIIKQGELDDGGRKIAITVAKAVKIRRKKVHGYLVGRLVARKPGAKVLISVQAEAHGDRIDDFTALVTRLMEKLELNQADALFAGRK